MELPSNCSKSPALIDHAGASASISARERAYPHNSCKLRDLANECSKVRVGRHVLPQPSIKPVRACRNQCFCVANRWQERTVRLVQIGAVGSSRGVDTGY